MTLALRFISGKYQGGEFPLEENRELIVGRSSELDMVLVEEMVSRKHARLLFRGGRVEIEDLGSTNGTFVNGERIARASVGEGDRILIGSNILRVIAAADAGQSARSRDDLAAPVNRRGVRRGAGSKSVESRMSGDLEEIPLPDLLQLFGSSKKDGILLVDSGASVGRVVLRAGVIHYAQLDQEDGSPEPLPPLKAVYRMLLWDKGVFELDPPDEQSYEEVIDLSVQEVLMEAFRLKDEMSQLQGRLPPRTTELLMPKPLSPALADLAPEELQVLQMAHNQGTIGATVDRSQLSDLATVEALVALLDKQYLVTEP